MSTIKRTCKDTVFTTMFGDADKEYLLQLYQALHPEDDTTGKDDLEIVTLENIFTNSVYNDLGFLADKKLIVLVEAQSTWSVNILIRMFIYLGKTYRNYIYSDRMLKRQLYTNTKIELPKPEMYVIYTGDEEKVQKVLSLRDEYFAGENVGLDLKIDVITADKGSKDVIWQYIMFSKVYDEQVRMYGYTVKAVLETIRICKERGYLAEYLSAHEEEVEDMLLWSKEEIEQDYRDMLVEQAVEKTRAESSIEIRHLKEEIEALKEENERLKNHHQA